MIYIVHGEDTVKSRTLLINQQHKLEVETKIDLNAADITPQELFEYVTQTDMFGQQKFIVLNIPNTKMSNEDVFVEILVKTPQETTIVLYAEKPLPKRNVFIKNAKTLKARIIENEYKPQGNVFKFTDNLFYKNRIQTYKELEKLLNEEADEFRLFSSILYGLRNITYYFHDCSLYMKLKPFQKTKIEKQAENFSKQDIKDIYANLYELEKAVKTGKITPEVMLIRTIEKILTS